MQNLISSMLNGDRRSLSKLVSAIEQGNLDLDLLVNNIQDKISDSYTIGITGPPGSGKSTVASNLINMLSKENLKVAFLAVDPTSPFDGGALLGDRIRVADLNLNENVFIRSMGTRGSVGGLNVVVGITVDLFAAFGFDIIIVESVGVGQVDIDIMNISDTVIVTTVPTGWVRLYVFLIASSMPLTLKILVGSLIKLHSKDPSMPLYLPVPGLYPIIRHSVSNVGFIFKRVDDRFLS